MEKFTKGGNYRPGNELRFLSLSTHWDRYASWERSISRAGWGYADLADCEHSSYRKLPLPCRNPEEGVCLLKITLPADSWDETTRRVRCCLVLECACVCACWGHQLWKAFLKVVRKSQNTTLWQMLLTPSQIKTPRCLLITPPNYIKKKLQTSKCKISYETLSRYVYGLHFITAKAKSLTHH